MEARQLLHDLVEKFGQNYVAVIRPNHIDSNRIWFKFFPHPRNANYATVEESNPLANPLLGGEDDTVYHRHMRFQENPEHLESEIRDFLSDKGWFLNSLPTESKTNLSLFQKKDYNVLHGPDDWPDTSGDKSSPHNPPVWVSESVTLKLEALETTQLDMDHVRHMFHITDRKNLASIMSQGIHPRSETKHLHYPDRVYVWVDRKRAYRVSFGPAFTETDDVVVLVINPQQLDPDTTLHFDPGFGGKAGDKDSAYFITEPVPPGAIEEIEEPTYEDYEKTASSMRNRLIRVAYHNPDIRKHLLPLLVKN